MRNVARKIDKKIWNLMITFERVSFLISMIGLIILYIFFKFYIDKEFYEVSCWNLFILFWSVFQ